MIVSTERDRLPAPPDEGAVVSVGVFDGVHLGHEAILRENVAHARALGATPTVVTFRHHPKAILLGHAPRTLTSLDHRLDLFRRAGIAHTVVLTFDEHLRSVPAAEFAAGVLVGKLGARRFVLGFDSKFGRDREGTPERLRALGYDVVVVPEVLVAGRPVSSTAIREAVELGDLDGAARMLGRPVAVYGDVVAGDGRGRQLGFPTANLDLHHELHPPTGVYAGRARIVRKPAVDLRKRVVDARGPEPRERERASKGRVLDLQHLAAGPREQDAGDPVRHPAVANVGFRPTIAAAGNSRTEAPLVEVHLLDFAGDLYGEHLELEFLARLRDEQRFPDLASLRRAIDRDVERARAVLADARTPLSAG